MTRFFSSISTFHRNSLTFFAKFRIILVIYDTNIFILLITKIVYYNRIYITAEAVRKPNLPAMCVEGGAVWVLYN